MASLKRRAKRIGLYGVVASFCFFAAAPFAYMLITMFKQDRDLYRSTSNPFFFSDPPTLDNLRLLFSDTLGVSAISIPGIFGIPDLILIGEVPHFAAWLFNSFFIGVLVVVITLIIAIPAAYSLARLTGRWGEQAGILVFLVYLIPPTLLFIPLFRVVVELGLNNTVWSLVLVYPTITIPFCTWLLMGFFKSIPRDLEEQALVDGYSRIVAFLRVVMPLSLSGVIAVVVFTFALTLHEFIYALTFISASDQRTIGVGVPTVLIRGDVFFWQSLLAAAFIVGVPVAIVYSFFLDRLVAGFTGGAVKG